MKLDWGGDERRVKRALSGDREAAKQLVDAHYPNLVRFLLHLTGQMDRAEEIAQETFVRAWPRLDTFRGHASFKTWIHAIAYREFLADRSRRPLDVALVDEPLPDSDFSQGVVERIAIEKALSSLSEELRLTFLLVNVQGLSVREVAEVLGIPRGTVLSRLATARERLARLLISFDAGGEPDPKPLEGAKPYETTPLSF